MQNYDAVVIGGGITGAGIARDLALRGLKTLLAERSEPGAATTAASTHLIHGGLRYLLYDRPTTVTTCWDSGNIVRIARPLLRRLPILWPVYRGHKRGFTLVETLLECYDRLSPMKYGRPHLRLGAEETVRLVPGLETKGLLGALVFDEWWVPAAELVKANLESAKRAGAEVRLGSEAVSLLMEEHCVRGVTLQDREGAWDEVRADVVVNAAGPWVGRVARMAGAEIPLRLRKGTHLVYEGRLPCLHGASMPLGLILEAEDRERYVFLIPGDGRTLLGPTDLDGGSDPDKTAVTEEETRYLLASVRRYFPEFPGRPTRATCGARPILGRGDEKKLSREYEIIDHGPRDGVPGLLSAAGGKMSDFRLMGEDTGETVRRLLGRGGFCRSHLETLSRQPVRDFLPYPRPVFPAELRKNPLLRELHALSWLGVGLGVHLARAAAGKVRESTAEDFEKNYSDKARWKDAFSGIG